MAATAGRRVIVWLDPEEHAVLKKACRTTGLTANQLMYRATSQLIERFNNAARRQAMEAALPQNPAKLERTEQLALTLMKKHGLVRKGWTFRFSHMRALYGMATHYNRTIRMSRAFVLLNSAGKIRNVILHEIAHALVSPKHMHDEVWRRKALEIGCDGRVNQHDTIKPITAMEWKAANRLKRTKA